MGSYNQVSEIMIRKFHSLSPDTAIGDAIDKLIENGVSSMLVVDDNGLLCGVFSEKDAIKPYLDKMYFDNSTKYVKEVMTKDVICLKEDDSLTKIAEQFMDSPHHRFPVLTRGILVGLVSLKEIIEALKMSSSDTRPKEKTAHAPIIGSWHNKFEGEEGNALPSGFKKK